MIKSRKDIRPAIEEWDKLIDNYDGNLNKSYEFVLEYNDKLLEALAEAINLAEDLYTGEL